jgi:hypothetical protein
MLEAHSIQFFCRERSRLPSAGPHRKCDCPRRGPVRSSTTLGKTTVLIENAVLYGARFVSAKNAARYVRQGRAHLSACGTRLRFIETDYRCASATEQALLQNHGYDERGRLKLDEIRHLPCVQAQNALHTRRPKKQAA